MIGQISQVSILEPINTASGWDWQGRSHMPSPVVGGQPQLEPIMCNLFSRSKKNVVCQKWTERNNP